MYFRRLAFALALPVVAAATPALAEGDPAAGEKVFRKCKACHSLEANGKHKLGPNLNGVIGRTAGSAEGYKYSKAMRAAEIVWSEDTLDAYLAAPKKYVPGNKMPFPGLKKAEDRTNVIAYVKSKAAE